MLEPRRAGFPHVVSSDEIAPREILLLEEISGKHTRICATFKKYVVKTTFKLKIIFKRNPLNFQSIQ
jgi:hypothetical protein